jgi:two-component system sensor histidine kinase/response regulator
MSASTEPTQAPASNGEFLSVLPPPPAPVFLGADRPDPPPATELKASILLVDDRPDKLLALEAVISSLGQNILKARSGKEALRLLLKQDVAVILLDVSMPGMDGFETAALIRQRPNSEHTPIIFITSISSTENHVAQGYSLGAVDYLLTPIVPQVLRGKVSVLVQLHHQTELIKNQAEQLRRDLIARQEAEAKISSLNRELERRLAALTEVNRELETFNYSIAHDLRAPLRSMSGFAKALLSDEARNLSPDGLAYAGRIARAAKYMDGLLGDLLAYSRLVHLEMPPELVRLEQPIEEILSLAVKEIADRGVRVEVLSPLAPVRAHLPTVKQILSNLILNGLKFTSPDRPPFLRVWTEIRTPAIRLWVEDDGIGIPPDYHERIFGLFHRLHTSEAYPGTGVGLAIVRKGAERMGGRAGVESQSGQGSRFWVDLPAAERNA